MSRLADFVRQIFRDYYFIRDDKAPGGWPLTTQADGATKFQIQVVVKDADNGTPLPVGSLAEAAVP